MPVVLDAYEAVRMKSGAVVLTFDADSLRPAGHLISADIKHAVLTLTWSDGSRCRLPDVRDRLAAYIAAAPTISVRWVSDGLLRCADFARS